MTLLPALWEALPSSGTEDVLDSSWGVFLRGVGPGTEESALKSGREPSLSWISW